MSNSRGLSQRERSRRERHAHGSRGSHDKWAVKIRDLFGPDVFDPAMPVGSEVIVAKAIQFRVDRRFKPRFQGGPLRRIHFDLEYRELYALAVVLARFGNSPEPAGTPELCEAYIVGHQNEHVMATYFQNQGG